MDAVGTLLEPVIFLSGDTNFRDDIAIKKGYKANRKPDDKPFHLANMRAYLTARFNTYTSRGCEADDLICIAQMDDLRKHNFDPDKARTVICTRDKDLRQCMGWHYGWEIGLQPEYPLRWIDEIGDIDLIYKEGVTKKGKPSRTAKKLIGTGLKWFYAQLLTGDTVDNIPGLQGCGIVKAFNTLDPLKTNGEMLKAVTLLYKEAYDGEWFVEMTEQAHLVWMIRERNPDGGLKWWSYGED